MKRQEEYLNYMMLESIRKDAALKIQSSYRGMIGRRLFSEAQQHFEEEAMESLRHDSATMLQASFRGYRDRKIIQEETARKENNHKQNIAATKLQASFRGYRDRVTVADRKLIATDRSFVEEYGSTKIQALYRGHLARRFACGYFEQLHSVSRLGGEALARVVRTLPDA